MTEIKKLLNSTVEIRGELPTEIFESFREPALHALGQETKLPGFRPGHVPYDVLTREIGEEKVLYRMAELALNQHYPKLLAENKIDALGRPSISLTKIAAGNPLGFIVTTAIHPKIVLPDYRALATEANVKAKPSAEGLALTVTNEEVDAVIKNLEKIPEKDRPNLPESELRTKIKTGLAQEKKLKARDQRRLEIIEKILAVTPIELPPILIESELETMIAEMKHEVGRMGLPFDQYLTHLKKTEADLRRDWQTPAEHRVKTGLVLAAIAQAEKIEAPVEELEVETKRLLAQHPQADPARARAYLASLIINERVFQLLESA